MFGTQGKVASFLRVIGGVFLFYVALVTYQAVQDGLANQRSEELIALDNSIDPVRLLELDGRICLDEGFIISGYLDKTRYPTGEEATFKDMLVYNTDPLPKRIPWTRTDENDESPKSRRYGEQSIDFVIKGPCEGIYTVDTRHESPLTGRIITMEWGPYFPPID